MVKPCETQKHVEGLCRSDEGLCLGSGGNQGQQIRDEILHIMPEPKLFKTLQASLP